MANVFFVIVFVVHVVMFLLSCGRVSRGKEGIEETDGLQFGKFDLGFAVDVLETVYEQELHRRYVLWVPHTSAHYGMQCHLQAAVT